jgi:nucleotide-binding universal stress UspA family protein
MNNKKILIAYDGSEGSNAALDDLKRAGLPNNTEAVVVTIADVFMPPTSLSEESIPESVAYAVKAGWNLASERIKEAKNIAERAAKKIQTDFPSWKVQAEAFADSPGWGIIKKAESYKADLIVVGAQGLSATERLLIGSTSQLIATQAQCSVRIVHRKPDDLDSPLRLVVGIDGSPASYAALGEVASRNWKKGIAIHIITVEDPRMLSAVFSKEEAVTQWIGNTQDRGQYWIKRLIEDAVNKLGSKGFAVTSLNKQGEAKKVLLEEAKRWGADCIFVGARGLTGIKHALIGSVSSSLAARAHCSVEIIRAKGI